MQMPSINPDIRDFDKVPGIEKIGSNIIKELKNYAANPYDPTKKNPLDLIKHHMKDVKLSPEMKSNLNRNINDANFQKYIKETEKQAKNIAGKSLSTSQAISLGTQLGKTMGTELSKNRSK